MKRKRLLILLLLCMETLAVLHAQTYQGKVTDNQGRPLASVSVLLMGPNGKTVKFTKTNAEGVFSITMPDGKDASRLAFICVGYARMNIGLNVFKNRQTVKMEEKVQEIREVKVTPKLFRIQGDTIAYSVQGLREKQDRTIEDVIARIPGIKVSTNGQISYKGMGINKFYVDHKDMAGGNYSLISRNMSADNVDSVEIMENHQPVKSLRGKVFSENPALNLVMNENAKSRWIGTAELGSGMTLQTPLRWNRKSRLVEMFLGRKNQTMAIYRHNNIGENITNDATDMEASVSDNGILSNIEGVGVGRRGFNNSHIGVVDVFRKLNDDNDFRFQLFGVYDKSTSRYYSETSYLDIDSIAVTREQRNVQSYKGDIQANFNYQLNAEKWFVKNILTGSMSFDHSESHTTLNSRELQEKVVPRKRNVSNWLTFSFTPGHRYTFGGSSTFYYTYLPGRLLLFNGNQERVDIHALQGNTKMDFSYFLKGKWTLVTSVAWLTEDRREYVAYNDTANHVSYDKNKIDLSAGLNYHDLKCNVRLYNMLSYLSQSIGTDEERRWICTPSVSVRWKFDRLWNFNMMYNHRFTSTGFYQANPIRVYTSYNTVTAGTGKFDNTTGDSFNAGIGYSVPGEGFSGGLSYGMNRSAYSHLYESRLNEGVYERRGRDETGDNLSQNVGGDIGYYYHALKTKISYSCRYSWSDFDIIRNQLKTTVNSQSLGMGLSLTMRPCRVFNYEANSYMSVSRQKVMSSNGVKYMSFSHSLNLFFTPGSWLLTMRNECRHSPDGSEKFNVYSEASLSYKTKRYELKVDCKNLWGDNKREYKSFSALGSSYSVIEYRPREVLASVIFSI